MNGILATYFTNCVEISRIKVFHARIANKVIRKVGAVVTYFKVGRFFIAENIRVRVPKMLVSRTYFTYCSTLRGEPS